MCHITPQYKYVYPSSLNVLHNSVLWHHKTKAAIKSYLRYVQHHMKIVFQITLHKIKSVFSCVTELVNIIMLQHERKHQFCLYGIKGIQFLLRYTDYCSKRPPYLSLYKFCASQRKFVAFLVISLFRLTRLPDSMIRCKNSLVCYCCL